MFAAVGVGDQYQPSGLETNVCSQVPFFGIFVLLYIFSQCLFCFCLFTRNLHPVFRDLDHKDLNSTLLSVFVA